MARTCEACGGSVKQGILGKECSVCGLIVDGVVTPAPCANGMRVAGVNRCRVGETCKEKTGAVYEFLLTNECSMSSECPGFKLAAPAKDAPPESKDRWDRAKAIVSEQTGSDPDGFSDENWGLVTHIWQGMERTKHNPTGPKLSQVGQWCLFLNNGVCEQPIADVAEDGTPVKSTRRFVIIGECPYADNPSKQKYCTLAIPIADMKVALKAFSKEALRPLIAHWIDVRNKAIRLRTSGRVNLLVNDNDVIVAEVQGDNGDYRPVLYRQDEGWSITTWECDCEWGKWAWNRTKYFGRMCSHAYAALMEAQSEKMRGPGVLLYQHQYTASVKEGTMAGDICGVCHEEAYDLVAEPLTAQRICLSCMNTLTRQAAVAIKLGEDTGFESEFLNKNLGAEQANKVLAGIRVRFTTENGRFACVQYEDNTSEFVPKKSQTTVPDTERKEVQVEPKVEPEVEGSYDEPDDAELASLQAVFANNPDFQDFQRKQATRNFTFAEQQSLIDEGIGSLARNLDRVRTEGTHFDSMTRYEEEEATGLFL